MLRLLKERAEHRVLRAEAAIAKALLEERDALKRQSFDMHRRRP